MTPTAQEMAEESSKKLAGELMTLLAFKKDTATVEDFCKVITKQWTAFAKTHERAVWEEAAKIATTGRFHFPSLAEEFRRRSTGWSP